ncbi:MAG TPA: tRNA (guanosine(46)-N7)-methyltransferase TrmB [Casimicrobiaceae bacterium]
MSPAPDEPCAPPARRGIRSFVLRQGRMSPAQLRAWQELFPRYGVDFTPRLLDFAALFGRRAPVVLEIGFGMGETTVHIAAAHPHMDFLGVEVHLPGVGALLRRVHDAGLRNVRVIRHDVVEVVHTMIAHDALAGVHVYFPDPWPKKRHHKRRLLQAPFVHALAERVARGGYLHVATDWLPYGEDMLATLSAEPLLVNRADGYAERPPWRPETKFERRGVALGHPVIDLLFERR